MHIEEQRWAPLPSSFTPASGGNHPVPEGVGLEFGLPGPYGANELLVAIGNSAGQSPPAGRYFLHLARSFTEFASYSFFDSAEVVNFAGGWVYGPTVGDEKPGRPIDLTHSYQGQQLSPTLVAYSMISVANSGTAARKWWWSAGPDGATAAQLADVINGKAWSAGEFKKDNIKKKLVALSRNKLDGTFRFILNEWKGEAWWWGHGASIANITSVIKGEAWADFRKDGIEKRLVLLKRHAPGNWTFIMVPRDGLGWAWYPKIQLDQLISKAQANKHRVIAISPWALPDPQLGSIHETLEDPVSAVTVQNT